MIRIVTTLFLIGISITSFAQTIYTKDFTQPYLTFRTCDESQCLEKQILNDVKKLMNEDSLLDMLSEKNSLFFGLRFIVNKDGSVFRNSIKVDNPSEEFADKLGNILASYIGINPVRNEVDTAILESFELYAELSLENGNIVYKKYKDATEFNENAPDKKEFISPIYKGCKKYSDSNRNLKKCFSNNMKLLINDNFNVERATANHSFIGTYRTFIVFAVNEAGKIVDTEAFSQTKEMGDEALNSIKNYKKITPGVLEGKAKNTSFVLPITLRLD